MDGRMLSARASPPLTPLGLVRFGLPFGSGPLVLSLQVLACLTLV